MPAAPLLMDECLRLDALHALGVLDTPSERRFERLAALAKLLARSQTSAISLVDANRQWFMARQGLDTPETPREVAFCGYTILSDKVLWVEDAAADPRFLDNALVLGPPHIRFYAGAPVCLAGAERIGTVCVFGPEPRPHEPAVDAGLKLIAELVAEALQE
jgi:GAF domain-containing protein